MKDFLQSQTVNEAIFRKIKIGSVEFMATKRNAEDYSIHLLVTKSAMLDDFNQNKNDYKTKVIDYFRKKTGLPWLISHDANSPGIAIELDRNDFHEWIMKKV